jgi:hypothetical protein
VPYVLDLLRRWDVRITVFVVGADAAGPDGATLGAFAREGHEVGNHSHEHESWLDRYERSRLTDEIVRAEQAITAATGVRPVGFRGPGYSWSPSLLEVLAERGYRYDASSLPTFLGPLARAYYFRSARLTPAQRAERAGLFGRARDGLRPNRPFRWRLGSGRTLLEIPVTTMPVLRVPFHLSYLLYLARYSELAMDAYLRLALAACRLSRLSPSFLLHPLDLIGGDQVRELAFFPGMDLPSDRKAALADRVVRVLRQHWELVPLGVYADTLEASAPLAERPAGEAGS